MTRSFDPVSARATPPVAALPDRACKDVDLEVFYPKHGLKSPKARDICGLCPHNEPCLEWALETNQNFGFWAGTSPDERAELRKERGMT